MTVNQPSPNIELTTAESRQVSLDSTSPTPLYHQIFVRLRDKIYQGDYKLDSYLPSEPEIVALFGVSRITAKRALDEIAAAGLAVREQGRGTRVCIRPGSISVRGGVEGLIHSLHAKGSSRVRLLDFNYIPAPKAIADKLGIPVGDEVQCATRIWHADAGPFNYLSTFVPSVLGRQWSRDDLEHRTLLSLLEGSGVTITRAEESITATLADEVVAGSLEVAVGSALLKITRVMFDERGKAVEYLAALYPPDRYQYTVSLGRDREPVSSVHPLRTIETN
jgi:GntR family transcriptional regulator